MTKNGYLNALAGVLYVGTVASFMFYSSHLPNIEPSVFIPMGVISLFVFSASAMGYIFLYWPLRLYLDGAKEEAAGLFLRTLFSFGGITAGILLIAFMIKFYNA